MSTHDLARVTAHARASTRPRCADGRSPCAPTLARRRTRTMPRMTSTKAIDPSALETVTQTHELLVDEFGDAYETFPQWQLWFGFFAGVFPFAIAAYEFGKRALIQRRCAYCSGSGLISVGPSRGDGSGEPRLVKCTQCGGFLPWQSWERFLSSDPGNGGVLRAPKGQTSAFYDVGASVEASRRAAQKRDEEEEKDGGANSDEIVAP